MIISREYVTFRKMVESNDPGGVFFMDCLHEAYPEYMWHEAYDMLADLCLYQREMEWGFHGIGNLIKGFKKIDKEFPYDNGYTMADVWYSEVLSNEDGKVTILLFNSRNDDREIIKVAKIK